MHEKRHRAGRTSALTREPTGATNQSGRDALGTTNRPTEVTMASPTYMGSADPVRSARYADYFPGWLSNLAEDVTIEGSLLDGAAEGWAPSARCTSTSSSTSPALRRRRLPRGLHRAGRRRARRGGGARHQQRGRPDPARRGQLPATQLAAADVPPSFIALLSGSGPSFAEAAVIADPASANGQLG